MANSGYLRVEGVHLCYTDGFSKYSLPYDSGYSTSVGADKKGYLWLDDNDLLRIYYVDERGNRRRTDVAESLGNVGASSKGYMRVGTDGYLYFIGPTGGKMRINGTATPIVADEYLYFESVTSCSVKLGWQGDTPPASLEITYDKNTWSDYTLGSWISLNNAGDKVYWRNKSAVQTAFTDINNGIYSFEFSGNVICGGNITYLLCKDGTTDLTASGNLCFGTLFQNCTTLLTAPSLPATTLTDGCYSGMFDGCTSLTTPPSLPATTLAQYCYYGMFDGCTSLTSLPALSATILQDSCYDSMFAKCTSIKLSQTQTGEYQTPYRIPTSGTGTTAYHSLNLMFENTGGTFTGGPNINQTYYTSNTVIS